MRAPADRLAPAFPDPPAGRSLLIGPPGSHAGAVAGRFDSARTVVVQGDAAAHAAFAARGMEVAASAPDGPAGAFDRAVVFLPRARAAARARIAAAAACLAPGASLWLDGQKTDGIDAVLREMRALAPVGEVLALAHGKIFAVTVPEGAWLPADWAAVLREVAPGFVTLPGVFSADGPDPGSQLLAAALPARLPATVVDLGVGWGWLAAQVLARDGVQALHLVESDHDALACAQRNITDSRARFHWADATDFRLGEPVGAVVMNPPFHTGRAADPGLGQGFIATAARLLGPSGRLWMVANRHLPYEAALRSCFAHVDELGGDSRYKLLGAHGTPARGGRRR